MPRKSILFIIILLVALSQLTAFPPLAAQEPRNGSISSADWSAYQDDAVNLLQQYIRINTSNPPGDEIKAAEFFHRLFDTVSIPNQVYIYTPNRADFYAVLKGDGEFRPLVLLNHMDVVRADAKSWGEPPFSGTIVNGVLYGRGAEDMKDEGLMQAMVMLIAARQHRPLKRDLIFLATADEEVDDTGSEWFIKNHSDLLRGAEYLITEGGANLITPDHGTIYGIDVAEKAPYWVQLTAHGRGGHGSIPLPDSAPNRLVEALNRVIHWQTPVRLLPSVEEYFHQIAAVEPEPLASELRNVRQSLKNPDFVKQLSAAADFNYQIRDTVSLTMLKGSEQTNVIPATASAQLDVRLLPGDDPAVFAQELKKVIDNPNIDVAPVIQFRPPNSSSTHTKLYQSFVTVIHEYNPKALVVPLMDSGYTESQMYRPLGIDCYGFVPIEVTPELEATEHAPNERVPVDQIRRGIKMLYEVVTRMEQP
jgi:acetylornithine deacetylase/succinyl-diaminopimelate desuccinylase-like protein